MIQPVLGNPSTPEAVSTAALAARMTRGASRHTYAIIRWLADRDLVDDGFRAYAYFRWLDDVIDVGAITRDQRLAFVQTQKALLRSAYQGAVPQGATPEEGLLVDLIRHERRGHGGLESYVRNMMAVMEFDADRRGRLISTVELDAYTRLLSTAVMDGLSYFIGNSYRYPQSGSRYSAVAAAHISHMLRDAADDVPAGYYNIPREVLQANRLSPGDLGAPAYRDWVRSRVVLARDRFREGKRYIGRIGNLRARLAGTLYCGRFESVLDRIERDGYLLRPAHMAQSIAPKADETRAADPAAMLRTRSSEARQGG
jgi:phytoene/squalene synthetase